MIVVSNRPITVLDYDNSKKIKRKIYRLASNPNLWVMVVDDEKDILDIIKMALEKYNYLVRSHTDPRDALEDITSSPSQYSILLTDIRMPYMTGMQLATEAMKINAAIEIIFMTAFEMDEQTILAYPHLKRDEVMQKPFKVKELCDSIRKRLPKSG